MPVINVLLGIPECLMFFIGPLLQLLFYPFARLVLKKLPPPLLYWGCFVLNTVLLWLFANYEMSLQDPAEIEPMDAFDGLIQILIWAPSYLGVLIFGIVTTVKYLKSRKEAGN